MTLTAKMLRHQILAAARDGESVVPRCPHAKMCGGCTFQDRAYTTQVAAKRAALQQMWADILPGDVCATLEVVPSPDPYAYRTRMDYVATKGRFGLRRGGKFNYIVELDECHLIPPSAFAVAKAVYTRAVAIGLPDYNLRTHEGFLRYIVVRRSPQDTLLIAVVTSAPAATSSAEDALEELAVCAVANPAVASFHWLINDTMTDGSFGTSVRHWAAETLAMEVGQRTLHIGPNTFFQNNVHLLLPLLDDVARQVGHAGRVADLYGGVGTIALHVADQVKHIICVESVVESVNLARHNIAANRVTNVTAVETDVLSFLQAQAPDTFEVLIADPPRTGLEPSVCGQVLRLRPRKLVYVSCNPLTLLEDARILLGGLPAENHYCLSSLRGYDMFPHTPHLEALAVFDRV